MIHLLLILLLISTTPESTHFGVKDKAYLKYTYEDEQHFEKGVAQAEKGKYKQALKELEQVEVKNLSRYDETKYYYYKGYSHVMEGQISRALSPLKKVVSEESDYQTPARYYYAYCLYRQHKYDKALPYLEELEAMGKYRKTVPYYLMQIYYSRGEDKEVQKRAEILLAEGQGDAAQTEELHRILGEIYYREGRYKDALKNLKQVKYRQDSVGEYAYMAMGHCQVLEGKLSDAKLSYLAAAHIGLSPKTKEEAMYNYAMCAYKTSTALGEGITAVTDFLSAYPDSKHREEVQGILCEALVRSKNYQAALDALHEMKSTPQIERTRQQLRYLLGTDAFQQGQMHMAAEWMSDVLSHASGKDTYRTDALYWRAEAEYRQNQYAAAAEDVQRYFAQSDASTNANNTAAYYLQGYAYFAQAQYNQALRPLLTYVDRANAKPELVTDARCRIADCYFVAKQYSEAARYYAQVSAKNGRSTDYALYQQGLIQGLQKQYKQKEETMQTLVNRYPKSVWAEKGCYELARAQVAQDEYREAIRTYEMQLKRYPRGKMAPEASLERAMLYANLQQTDDAIAAYKSTISSFPATEEAYQAIDALQQIYVSQNRLSDYVAYTKSLGKMKMNIVVDEDSLSLATAEGQYLHKNWAAALKEYKHLEEVAEKDEYYKAAREGIFRCNQQLHDAEGIHQAAAVLVKTENPQTELYAEATYNLAKYQYEQGDKKAAEELAMDLLQGSNQHQYWLAKSLILVADIEMERGELFQAKQYLLTLQRTYKGQDEVAREIESRLSKISEQEKANELKEDEEWGEEDTL